MLVKSVKEIIDQFVHSFIFHLFSFIYMNFEKIRTFDKDIQSLIYMYIRYIVVYIHKSKFLRKGVQLTTFYCMWLRHCINDPQKVIYYHQLVEPNVEASYGRY